MNLLEFSEIWIDENVDDELYTTMPERVRQLVDLLIQQNHSGASSVLVLKYFFDLMEDYNTNRFLK